MDLWIKSRKKSKVKCNNMKRKNQSYKDKTESNQIVTNSNAIKKRAN